MLSSEQNTQMFVDAAIISAFILPERRGRYLQLVQTKRGRIKFRKQLGHFRDFDTKFMKSIPAGQQTAKGIEILLRQQGAPSVCAIISESEELDNIQMDLTAALSKIVGYGTGSVLSSLHGRLAYYESEEPGHRYILQKR